MIRACIEAQSLRYYIDEAQNQNKHFFQLKARELIEREKDDMVAAAQANLLFQKLLMTREQILQKYPEVKITTEDLEEGANKIENKDAQLESEQDSLKFNYHENEQFKADEKSLIDESNNINF